MRRSRVLMFGWIGAALAFVPVAAAAASLTVVTDTMPGNQYQLCMAQSVDAQLTSGGGFAGNFTVPRRTHVVQVTLAVAGQGGSAAQLRLAIEGNTTVSTVHDNQWANVPDDSVVLARTAVTPKVSVANSCEPGQVITVQFPRIQRALIPGRTYWLVLRTPVGSTVADLWYGADRSQIGTSTTSAYVDYWNNDGVPIRGWYSYVPNMYTPTAYRVAIR